jgi:plasmid stability protein
MKTTLDLPDELMRSVRIRAARENRKLKDVVAELLRRGLAQPTDAGRPARRVHLPLVRTSHASPTQEVTPERAADALVDEEARSHA